MPLPVGSSARDVARCSIANFIAKIRLRSSLPKLKQRWLILIIGGADNASSIIPMKDSRVPNDPFLCMYQLAKNLAMFEEPE